MRQILQLLFFVFIFTFLSPVQISLAGDVIYRERVNTLRDKAKELRGEWNQVRKGWLGAPAGSEERTQVLREMARVDAKYRSLFGQIFELNDVLAAKINRHEQEGNLDLAKQIKGTREKLSALHRSIQGVVTIALPIDLPEGALSQNYLAEVKGYLDARSPAQKGAEPSIVVGPALLPVFVIGKDRTGKPLYGTHFTTLVPPQDLKLHTELRTRGEGRAPGSALPLQIFRLSPKGENSVRLEKLQR
ncbi:MAG: hypothetical protein HY391_00675 [Deltaproteobacteria bacterium]|nr:hypothetical protein [Deltaproteobacteria bacterium]